MANPVPVTYNAAASPVAGGRGVSVPMDVSANVWTPTKDTLGRIRLGSWTNLPLNEWCVVSGAALSQIASQLGVGPGAAAGQLAQVLPGLIDQLSPRGEAPQGGFGTSNDLFGMLGGLLQK